MKSEGILGKAEEIPPREQEGDRVAVAAPAASPRTDARAVYLLTTCRAAAATSRVVMAEVEKQQVAPWWKDAKPPGILVWGAPPVFLCPKWWEPVQIRTGNSSRVRPHALPQYLWSLAAGRKKKGNGKAVLLDFERDIDLGNWYSFFQVTYCQVISGI